MKCNKKKNKNKDTVTRQDMIILCLFIELFYLLGYYLGQYFFRRPFETSSKASETILFLGFCSSFNGFSTWVFFFCSFFGFESKEIVLSFCVFGNVETLELLLILSTRPALCALVFQRPASKSR